MLVKLITPSVNEVTGINFFSKYRVNQLTSILIPNLTILIQILSASNVAALTIYVVVLRHVIKQPLTRIEIFIDLLILQDNPLVFVVAVSLGLALQSGDFRKTVKIINGSLKISLIPSILLVKDGNLTQLPIAANSHFLLPM
jgi:hypothetical protein